MKLTLSPAEQEVYDLLIEGYGITEIAKKVSKAVTTIATHKTRIFKKIGVSNHHQLITRAVQQKNFGPISESHPEPKPIRSTDPNNDFSLEHYREILETILKTHQTICFRDLWPRVPISVAKDLGKFVVMRHDVEFSLPAALRLAEIDASLGIQSTFFFLQTSEYNLFEEEQAQIVRRIIALNHDIGLHYDCGLFEKLGLNAHRICQAQVDLFEAFFDVKIHAMSSHMPMRSGKTIALSNVIDTYDPKYMVEMKYLSDSNQSWREGVVTENLEKYDYIHLLTHEYIWHPYGWDWSALLFVEAKDKFDRAWKRMEGFNNQYREGFKLREEKDKEFKKRFISSDRL